MKNKYTVELTSYYTIHAESSSEVLEYVESWGQAPTIPVDHYPNELLDVVVVVRSAITGEVLLDSYSEPEE